MTQAAANAGGSATARPTLASSITMQLRRAILDGDLRPGTRLSVEALREQFAVSLSPLREALSRLGSAGLVEIEDQRGYRVAAVSDANLAEVIELRSELETLALRTAFARGGDAWRDRIGAAMTDLAACARNNARHDDDWEALHRRFHLAMLSGCNQPMLLTFIIGLHDQSDRYRRLFLATHAPDRDVPEEHRRIYEAIHAGEVDLACALLRQHIVRTGANVRAALAEGGA